MIEMENKNSNNSYHESLVQYEIYQDDVNSEFERDVEKYQILKN